MVICASAASPSSFHIIGDDANLPDIIFFGCQESRDGWEVCVLCRTLSSLPFMGIGIRRSFWIDRGNIDVDNQCISCCL